MPLTYKVVETSSVTDRELERILNEWTEKGGCYAKRIGRMAAVVTMSVADNLT